MKRTRAYDTLADDMRPIRICLVGGGLIWEQVHRRNLQRHNDRFVVSGICARSGETRKGVVKDFPDVREYTSIEELFDRRSVEHYDALLVLTPIPLNASVAIRGLERGKMVFVEKPVAMSEAECAALEVASRRAAVPLYILENNAYDSRFRTTAELVAAGRIGTPVSARRVTHLFLGGDRNQAGEYGSSKWRAAPDYPLGIVFDGGIHDLAGLRAIAGTVETVFADGRSLREGFGEYDWIHTVLNYRSGFVASFSHSSAMPSSANETVVYGTDGTIEFSNKGVRLTDIDGETSELETDGTPNHDLMWDALAAAATDLRDAEYIPSDGIADVRTLLAIERSIHTRRAEFVGA